jgi:hypothetical protein
MSYNTFMKAEHIIKLLATQEAEVVQAQPKDKWETLFEKQTKAKKEKFWGYGSSDRALAWGT